MADSSQSKHAVFLVSLIITNNFTSTLLLVEYINKII